jgi:hypothetical protein
MSLHAYGNIDRLYNLCRIFFGKLNEESKKNWIFQKDLEDAPHSELYITSFYFTVTTLVTVGYGDITPYSVEEKALCIFLMLIGIVSFSFATGTLASIITSIDS